MTRSTSTSDDAPRKPSSHRKPPPKRELKFTPEAWTADEIIEAGREASEVLASPVFNLACRSLMDSLQNDWANTQPHEKERREWLYSQMQALGATMHSLLGLFNQAQQLEAGAIAAERERQRRANEHAHGATLPLDS